MTKYPGSGREVVAVELTVGDGQPVHLAQWGRTLCGRSTGLAWRLVDRAPTCDRCQTLNPRKPPHAA